MQSLIVIKRDGSKTSFNEEKISLALTKAFTAAEGSERIETIHNRVISVLQSVLAKIAHKTSATSVINIEEIQDIVEEVLIELNEAKIAKAYILYRDAKNKDRQQTHFKTIHIKLATGLEPLDLDRVKFRITSACMGLSCIDEKLIFDEFKKNIFDGIEEEQLNLALVLSARQLLEIEPNYSYVAARLLLDNAVKHTAKLLDVVAVSHTDLERHYPELFMRAINYGVKIEILDKRLLDFDLAKLGASLVAKNDLNFQFLGVQTLYDRYFLHNDGKRFELPQIMLMRVAMGLSINEGSAQVSKEERAIEFYHLLSSFDFMCSTPTLFNSGCLRPQLSSCYLTTVQDDLNDIFDSYRRNALLSKWAGGLGNDWTPIRAIASTIKGTNGESQGVIPFLKIANDAAVAVNQGGKRKGAVCAYLEAWHLDIEDFIDLRKNTGDERRRTHDMNTAIWVNDLFMERVFENKNWTLFSPDEAWELHDLYGADFKTAYERYEGLAVEGKIKNSKTISAVMIWRKMLNSLFETGHPWITFKDPCNIRSPQQHVGIVHSSNLCTEITLNTSKEEVAVCNLGSVNLSNHIKDGLLDEERLKRTISTAVRMLDNVIDINFYPIEQARNSNLKHRPIGLGLMGFQDCLYKLGISYGSDRAVEFADKSMELISYYAIDASAELSLERGKYSSFDGSLWSQGIFPIDSISLLSKHREKQYLELNTDRTLDWDTLREKVVKTGLRNSNLMAIAPTATISNIVGSTQSIEPTYQNIFVKSNLSGEFTIVNKFLVEDLQKIDLWDTAMIADIKYYNGSIQNINRIPTDIKEKYQTAFEIDTNWFIKAAARRQKWIDQAQSLNIYIKEASGKKLDSIYKLCWLMGLKTTYYLRSLGATDVEKTNAVKLEKSLGRDSIQNSAVNNAKACSIEDPSCEVCQ